MSVHRRRLWCAGAVWVVMWAAVSALSSPAHGALAQFPSDASTSYSSASDRPSLLTLDTIILRPLVVLREPGQPGVVIAHRGDSAVAPENTMPAFASTTDAGAKYIEIDIRMSKDGVPVVIHDSTVDRTTNGTGMVSEMTIEELRALDAGSWFDDSFTGTKIPTLDEVASHIADSSTDVMIEYKGTWSQSAIQTTVEMLDAAGLDGRVITQSFSKKTVANISELAPRLPVGWLTEKLDPSTIATAQKIGADAVNPSRASAQGVALAHQAKLGVFVWTHDSDPDWESLTAMGVDGIITNHPVALYEWMHGKK
ncbi:glycerophosphodiester phosphodiesterase [Microbacterium sp. A82]|uniref:glycerophosphodiester phosphodiesterase n=1 Tax=unclassified Microbacterium TaxID=2609290 RepID=UPI003F3B9EBC